MIYNLSSLLRFGPLVWGRHLSPGNLPGELVLIILYGNIDNCNPVVFVKGVIAKNCTGELLFPITSE